MLGLSLLINNPATFLQKTNLVLILFFENIEISKDNRVMFFVQKTIFKIKCHLPLVFESSEEEFLFSPSLLAALFWFSVSVS